METLLINGDVRHIPIQNEVVQTVITLPPYFGLRDYGVEGQIGRESLSAYIHNLVAVFREVRRVLRPDGTVWLNLGDSFAHPGKKGDQERRQWRDLGAHKRATYENQPNRDAAYLTPELKPKDLIGVPWRVALALQADGWYLRADIIWHKPNPMPESVKDRPTRAHEYIFLLTKRPRYYYDAEAIAEPAKHAGKTIITTEKGLARSAIGLGKKPSGNAVPGTKITIKPKRNKRSVWTVATRPYREAHFATFPVELIKPMILAGSRPGDIVLDPFAGTATVGVAALQYGRRFIGIELNPNYIALARKRLAGIQPGLPL